MSGTSVLGVVSGIATTFGRRDGPAQTLRLTRWLLLATDGGPSGPAVAQREGRAGARGREHPSRDDVPRYGVTVAGHTAVGRPQAACRAVESERSRSMRVQASACARFGRRLPSLAAFGPRVGCPRWRMSVDFGRRGIDHRGVSLLTSRFGPVTAHRFGGGSGRSEASASR
jgi:hypothetical protein